MRIVLLGGAGIIGRVIARDLAEGPNTDLLIADLDGDEAKALASELGATGAPVDVTEHDALVELLQDADACVNSVQYYFNLDVMRACLESGTHYTDLGGLFHMTRKQLELDQEFRDAGLTAVLGMGSCPGVANVHAGYLARLLDTIEYVRIYNGSTPDEGDSLAWAYSLQTILDEITMSSMVFRDGEFQEMEPLSEEEYYLFREPVGWAKTHLSLHSEVATIPLSLADKGIRECFFKITFFGYSERALRQMQFLAQLGLASTEAVEVDGVQVRPRDMLMAVMARAPQTERHGSLGFKDIATEARGTRNGQTITLRVDTIAWPYEPWGVSGGTLLVASPPAIVARWLASGKVEQKGVLPPEIAVEPLPFFAELAERGVETTLTRTAPVG